MNVDGMFEAARQLGELVAKHRAAKRQMLKDARNARRRARYATVPRKPKPAPVVEAERESGCYCNDTPMPPCAWCESGGEPEETT